MVRGAAFGLFTFASICAAGPARADGDGGATMPGTLAVHAQSTFTEMGALPFPSPYRGTDSLPSGAGRETFDATVFIGARPWNGAEVWIDPELDQGFAPGNTEGVAAFVSGEGFKIGRANPYVRIHRWMLRQSVDLGGALQTVDPGQNELGGTQTSDRIVFTIGRLSVTDVFDANRYAHDPRNDFLNWAVIDTGTFDYAADAWGFTYGASAELYDGHWTIRAGVFDLSISPNDVRLDPAFGQFQLIGEVEQRYAMGKRAGKLAITVFLTRGRMAKFTDAIAEAEASGTVPEVADVRDYRSRTGVSANLEQAITDDVGFFARAGMANGSIEPFEYTDIDKTATVGVSITGTRWRRADDTVGIAGVIDGVSKVHQRYLALGGLGILVGDGKLPHPGPEEILETYYDLAIVKHLALTFDGQIVGNPAYNRDRGPAPVLGVRLHAQF
ncbi:MAG: carbohydrate porin [Caulobacteraceae bacterium]|nr:carbohydrate porin [Caulobacteraceae bacterium]